VDSCLQESSEHSASQAGRGEDAATLAELASCVPRAEDIVCPDEGGGFGNTLEEADCHDIAWMVDGSCEHGESAPDYHHAWEEDARLKVVESEVGRHLADDIAVGC